MSTTSTDYLVSPGLDRLWRASREAWERNGSLAGNAVLHDLSETEALEISGLLGKRRPLRAHTTARLPLIEIDNALRTFAMPLTDWLEQSGGNLVHRRQERANAASAKTAMWNEVNKRAVGVRSDLQLVIEDFQRTGLPRRLAGGNEWPLLEQTLDVLEAVLALERPCDIAVLAARHCGDAKALNTGNPIGTLVVRALALLAEETPPADGESRRQLWEQHGVVCNPLSSTVLTLNVRLDGDDFLARSLALSSHAGEPRVLTLRELGQAPGRVTNRRFYICENPTVVAAAAHRLGKRSAPLICTDGQPKTAATLLLTQLASAGFRLTYHGDFDWPGIQICNLVMQRHGAAPWRFDARHYSARTGKIDLKGLAVVASWDADLTPQMLRTGKAIHEEQVLDELLTDLSN